MEQAIVEQQENLIRLQRIDIESMTIKRVMDVIPDKKKALEDDLQSLSKTVEDAETARETLQKQYRDLEAEVKNRGDLVAKSQSKLNAAKTNKEYQSCLKEIDDIHQKVSRMEDEMLEILEKLEGQEVIIAEQKQEYVQFSEQMKTDLKAIERELREHQERLEELETQRTETAKRLDAEILVEYAKIQEQQPDGVAVAQVVNEVCQGCYLNIPPQMYNELQRCDSLKSCPFCNRLIYWKSE